MRSNLEVTTLLEHMLSIAKSDPSIRHCAISLVRSQKGGGTYNYTGPPEIDHLQRTMLQTMLEDIEVAIANRALPPRDPDLPANYVTYNLAHDPASFDFITWLVEAEMTRIREHAPAPLRVAFWTGHGAGVASDPKIVQWLNNVFRPALAMLGAVEDSTAMLGRHHEVYLPTNIVSFARSGERVPTFRSGQRMQQTGIITITLRETDRWPHRNSNLEAWLLFADYLERQGETVVFVRDTAKADQQLPRFKVCLRAAQDLTARLALYESAKTNLFISNGPGALASFSDCSYLQFIELQDDGHPYWINTPTFWKESMGLDPGDQWPWARPDQRLVWTSDSYDNLVAGWEDYRSTLMPAAQGCVAA